MNTRKCTNWRKHVEKIRDCASLNVGKLMRPCGGLLTFVAQNDAGWMRSMRQTNTRRTVAEERLFCRVAQALGVSSAICSWERFCTFARESKLRKSLLGGADRKSADKNSVSR
jgi:hypothetical protein